MNYYHELYDEFKRSQELSPEVKMDNIRKKLVQDCIQEMLTPLKLNLNVDLKNLRKHIEECMVTDQDHSLMLESC